MEQVDRKQQTINTYNRAAAEMATKFNGLGGRPVDIAEAFSYCRMRNPFVLEIGCGHGRDAAIMVERTDHYLGIDVAENFITMARATVPAGKFTVADVESYAFPSGLDVVFAFASLIHVPKASLHQVLKRLHQALNLGGVVRISMKHADEYCEVIKDDEFGTRTYFHYSLTDMEELCQEFKVIRNDKNYIYGQDWVEMLLVKG